MKLTVLLNKPQKDDFPWWCRSVTMSLLPVGISGDETEKLAISCQIRTHHHSTTATFTGLLLQYNDHEDREQSNPHTGPSFAHKSLSGTRWRKAVPALRSCTSKSVGRSKWTLRKFYTTLNQNTYKTSPSILLSCLILCTYKSGKCALRHYWIEIYQVQSQPTLPILQKRRSV